MVTMKPVYLLAGGRRGQGKKPDPLLQAVFREIGIDKPVVAYVGAASGDDPGFFSFIAAAFRAAGAGAVKHAIIAPDNADIDKSRDIVLRGLDAYGDAELFGGFEEHARLRFAARASVLPPMGTVIHFQDIAASFPDSVQHEIMEPRQSFLGLEAEGYAGLVGRDDHSESGGG